MPTGLGCAAAHEHARALTSPTCAARRRPAPLVQNDGGGIYSQGALTMLRCHLSSNIVSGSGHAIYFSTSASRAVVHDTTFVAGAATTGMFIYAGVEVDYGVCAGGRWYLHRDSNRSAIPPPPTSCLHRSPLPATTSVRVD